MNRLLIMMKSEAIGNVLLVVKIIAMLCMLYIYLMHADLSTAPEFIYNQF